jgi:sugar phosphate isomerase/epimerase
VKLSFSTLCCPDWSLEQIVAAAAREGIDGVDFRGLGPEIDITRLPAFTTGLGETLALFAQHKVAMPCFNTSVTLVCPAAERWQAMLEECHRYARLAGRTGTPTLRIFGGGVPKGMTHEEARMMAQRHLRQVSKICRDTCVPLVETHDDWNTAERVRELLHEFDPAEAGALWDVEHPFRQGESPADTARLLQRYLRCVHFRDSAQVAGQYQAKALGEGEVPLKECLAAMRDVGYDGWVCLEVEKRWHPTVCPEPEVAIPQFVSYMRAAGAV